MDRRLSWLRYAVMMDTADTSIIWRLILLIRDTASVNVCLMNASTACAAPASSESSSCSPTIIGAAVNFGVIMTSSKYPAQLQWELIYSRRSKVIDRSYRTNWLAVRDD